MAMLIAEQNVKFTDLICQRWYSIDKGAIMPLGRDPSVEAAMHPGVVPVRE
jgi:ABC-type lipopolysaccharide export system ATPase subunit